jgi:ABC-2 type transport system permease protein
MTEDKDRDRDQDAAEEIEEPDADDDNSLITVEGVADEEAPEAEEEPAEKKPAKRGKRRRREPKERPVPADRRAAEALGEERTLAQKLGMPALFLGLLALAFGIGWAIVMRALFRVEPLVCIGAGIVLLAYGIFTGLTAFIKQFHGRGSTVVLAAVGLSFALLLLLVGVNALSLTRHARFDLTKNRHYSLSDQSKEIVRKLTEDVTIQLVVQTNQMRFASYDLDDLKRLMREYEIASRHIKWAIVDLYKNPELQEEVGVSFGGKAVVKCGERREEVSLAQDNEEGITTAIYRVSKPDKDVVYYLTGHGEMALEEFGQGEMAASRVRKALENVQMDVEELVLKKGARDEAPVKIKVEGEVEGGTKKALEDVPDDAKAVMILGAKTPLASKEIGAIKRYLDQRQGGLLVALSFEPGAPDLHEILGDYGVKAKEGLVMDYYRAMNHPAIPYTENPEGHEILENIGLVQMPMVRAFEIESPEPEPDPYSGQQQPPQPDATALLKTSESARLAQITKSADGTIEVTPGAGAESGAQTTAVVIDTEKEKPPTPPGMPEPPMPEDEEQGVRIVALGSQFMLADNYQMPYRGTNTAFVTQAVSWLAGGEAISIPEKKPYTFSVNFGRPAQILISALVIFVIPLGTIALGIVVWWLRR